MPLPTWLVVRLEATRSSIATTDDGYFVLGTEKSLPAGNLKSQQRGSIVETYTYDARQRLTGMTLSSGGVSFQ